MAKATEQTEAIETVEQPTQAAAEATAPANQTAVIGTTAVDETREKFAEFERLEAALAIKELLLNDMARIVADQEAKIAEQTAEIERLGNVLVSATSQGPSPVAVEPATGEIPGCVAGRIVYYTPGENERFAGDALIVGILTKVWDTTTGCANIHLFPDGDNQNPEGLRPWVTSRMFDAAGDRTPATYRFTR